MPLAPSLVTIHAVETPVSPTSDDDRPDGVAGGVPHADQTTTSCSASGSATPLGRRAFPAVRQRRRGWLGRHHRLSDAGAGHHRHDSHHGRQQGTARHSPACRSPRSGTRRATARGAQSLTQLHPATVRSNAQTRVKTGWSTSQLCQPTSHRGRELGCQCGSETFLQTRRRAPALGYQWRHEPSRHRFWDTGPRPWYARSLGAQPARPPDRQLRLPGGTFAGTARVLRADAFDVARNVNRLTARQHVEPTWSRCSRPARGSSARTRVPPGQPPLNDPGSHSGTQSSSLSPSSSLGPSSSATATVRSIRGLL